MEGSIHSERESRRLKTAETLLSVARGMLWFLALGVMVIIPWSFGGNGTDGYYWIVWSGRLCVVPLGLWAVAKALKREAPGNDFWVPVICWGLLAGQVIISLHNQSHETEAPWVGDGYIPIKHNEHLPSTAFEGATRAEGHLWLAFGLLALTAKSVGLGRRQLRWLLWLFVTNATVLALIGIPFKFSGEKLILGKWPVQEWYFYSTFLYHNHWCAYALLAVAAAAALCSSSSKTGARIALIVAGIVIAGSAPLSTSRLGSLAMLAFGLVIAVTLISRRLSPERKRFRVAPILVVGTLLGIVTVGAATLYFYKAHGGPGGHRTWAGILHSNPFGLRQTFVEDTIPMLKKKPWFGWGLGAYGAAFRFYQRPETRVVHNEGRITLYDHIHDDWLERWAELGVIGFGLFLAPGIFWIVSGLRGRVLPSMERWLWFGCVGLLLFAFGDMAFVNRTVAASFALLLPLALSGDKRRCDD